MTIPLTSDEIINIVRSSDRPEFTLVQRYETSTAEQKTTFILALIGLVIESERRNCGENIFPQK
ncbi:hypothetical protein C5930_11100 [Cronobacter sakazakii]|nr:hypothetical protein C5930_11100 [Cronobacter sakazakii]PRO52797.1 hypothetical protein C5943_05550 [Cronobacter sakazakii]